MKMNSAVIVIPLLLIVSFVLFFTVIDFDGGKDKEHAETKTEGTSEQAETEGTAEEGTTENAETEGTENAAAVDTEAIYQKNCISCHGDQYQGGVGPQLTGISGKYDQAEIESILINGQGAMPGGLVSPEEASAMAEWLLTLK